MTDTVLEYYKEKSRDYASDNYVNPVGYPANQIKINHVIDRVKEIDGIRTILDVGCGTCWPMIQFLNLGYDVYGIDASADMIDAGKEHLRNADYLEDRIKVADIENNGYLPWPLNFDCLLLMGCYQHFRKPEAALKNCRSLIKKGGTMFCEMRNQLMSVFSLNKYSKDFFLNLIELGRFNSETQRVICDYYNEFKGGEDSMGNAYNKFSNPLLVTEEFRKCGFEVKDIYYYHYHCLPPVFQKQIPELFHKLSLEMENKNDWRGIFMASAFVIECI